MPLLLSDDHLAALVWLGLRVDAQPDEVLRAVVHQALDDRRVHRNDRELEQVEDRVRLLRVKIADGSASTGWTCPVCEAVGPEPCQDVYEAAAASVALASKPDEATPHPVLSGSVTRHSAWPFVLELARAHGGQMCEPDECDECIRALSVLQINAWVWGETPR